MANQPHQTERADADRKREFGITLGAGVLALAGILGARGALPEGGLYPPLLLQAALLLWVPLLAVLLPMGQQPATFGLQPGNEKSVRYGVGAFLLAAVLLPITLLLPITRDPSVLPFYHRFGGPSPATWEYMLYFHLLYGFGLFCVEWFFRGFLLYGLWRGIGASSLIVQALVFLVFELRSPAFDLVTALPTALVLGFVAWRCGSFLPGFLARWAATVYLDLLLILARRTL